MDEFQKIKERIPSATYRLQLNKNFTFRDADLLVDYLYDLGITHVYCSPILVAHSGSTHGYDVVDHSALNPELGTEEDFEKWVSHLREKNMGIIIDIVPNHMFIFDEQNKWWYNILENGPSSPYANYFDIDWHPLRAELTNKVLLPILDEQYGAALENQKLKVAYVEGAFIIQFYDMKLPTDPCSWIQLLKPVMKEQDEKGGQLELASIITALSHLPVTTEVDPEKIKERQREKEIIKQRLQKLLQEDASIKQDLDQYLDTLNGVKDRPDSFNDLEEFINSQPYRLCFWRVANNEINYRRFFDICALAGIRNELREVFDATHQKIFELVKKNQIDGLRIDHIDGLIDPQGYLDRLQEGIDSCLEGEGLENTEGWFYIVAEKILMGNEQARSDWKDHGTVGYDFLIDVNGLFVRQSSKEKILDIYADFTGVRVRIPDLFFECKKLILLVAMSGEHFVLSRILDKISEQHRSSRDFTEISLASSLRDVIANFPVYRSYINPEEKQIRNEDKASVMVAINNAKRRNPAINDSIFDFIRSVLLLEYPAGLTEEQIELRNSFVRRFQQLTSSVTAKGIEDTAFYRYHPLASLNEVGSTLRNFGSSVDDFHRNNLLRNEKWPHTLLCTSTHDTKRSEDARSRLDVLSEIAVEWGAAIKRWAELNKEHKTLYNDCMIPDENDEYALYQALVATWPLYPMDPSAHIKYLERIQTHMQKSMREAKLYSSWINPNQDYESAMQRFIQSILSLDPGSNGFLEDFKGFIGKVQRAGLLNALSMSVLKMTSPGVPDVYQGNELWDFSLVDPDNRHPVDFKNCQYLLETLKKKETDNLVDKLLENAIDGRIKLFVKTTLLNARRRLYAIFKNGEYIPLKTEGKLSDHLVAFARKLKDKIVLVVVSRYFYSLMDNEKPYVDPAQWEKTYVLLPSGFQGDYANIFKGDAISIQENQDRVEVSQIFTKLPIAVLESS